MSKTLRLLGHYTSLLSSTKGKWDINRVEMTFGDILGKGSFGEPFAVAATPSDGYHCYRHRQRLLCLCLYLSFAHTFKNTYC